MIGPTRRSVKGLHRLNLVQFKEMTKLFDTKFRGDVVAMWDAFEEGQALRADIRESQYIPRRERRIREAGSAEIAGAERPVERGRRH